MPSVLYAERRSNPVLIDEEGDYESQRGADQRLQALLAPG